MFYIYVLQSLKEPSLIYTGYSNNLRRRIDEHNHKLSKFTQPYAPWKIIYYEACLNEKDARRRENYLKKTQGKRMLKRRLKEYFYQLRRQS